MKKLFTIAGGAILFSLILFSCGSSTSEAIKYNDALVEQRSKVIEKENALIEAISKNMPEKLDLLSEEMKKQIDESYEIVNKMSDFDGKTDMKDVTIKFLTTYKEVAGNEYKEILKYAKMPDTLYTQEYDDIVMDLSKKVDDKLSKVDDDFIQMQKEFAKKYRFEPTSVESPLKNKN